MEPLTVAYRCPDCDELVFDDPEVEGVACEECSWTGQERVIRSLQFDHWLCPDCDSINTKPKPMSGETLYCSRCAWDASEEESSPGLASQAVSLVLANVMFWALVVVVLVGFFLFFAGIGLILDFL
ncbi:MAG: hypothetical protein SVG88_03675 [Halobacteriales archaeon]|nr:hypothetical protein [Halobacteriales archaeon]